MLKRSVGPCYVDACPSRSVQPKLQEGAKIMTCAMMCNEGGVVFPRRSMYSCMPYFGIITCMLGASGYCLIIPDQAGSSLKSV